jgi:hypothetical protein
MRYLTKIFFIFLYGCYSPEKSEQDKVREQNAKGEFIYRKSNETFYQPKPLKKRVREKYPWEET